jgi:NADH-quinone oxidoreductase subunit L
MPAVSTLALVAVISPVVAFVLKAVGGRAARRAVPAVSIALSTVTLAIASYLLYVMVIARTASPAYTYIRWLDVGGGVNPIGFSLYLDPLSVLMMFVVAVVALCVQVYSLSYMHGDMRFDHYYALLSLFSFSMLGLVLSANLLMTFVFWELVGLCSYLLIGFWFDRDAASRAANKAFIVTRLGDLGFLLAIALLFIKTGTLDIVELSHLNVSGAVVTAAALLLFVGAMGKSAQFPLHVWLPDAMEGPTPVSALIHAATMVAAGVYLVARNYFLFAGIEPRVYILAIGVVTAMMSAGIALFQRDIKKVLAFSTISQLGFMMAALGAGDQAIGMFHLTTHAFFKALLFLAAGAVVHAAHSLDIFEMGGLAKKMPWTAALFGIGALAIAGFPGTGGFFSKDAIIHVVDKNGPQWVYYALLATAFVTAFYIFRVYFRVFFGEQGKVYEDVHEADARMLVPMALLAVLSFAVIPMKDLAPLKTFTEGVYSTSGMITGAVVSIAGIALAYALYGPARREYERIKNAVFVAISDAFFNRLYIDDLYEAVFVRGYELCAGAMRWLDERVVDGFVNGTAAVSLAIGDSVRRLQSGSVQGYLVLSFSIILVIGYLYFLAGWGAK